MMNRESRGCHSELIKRGLNYQALGRMAKSYRVSGKELGSLEKGDGGNSSDGWFGRD